MDDNTKQIEKIKEIPVVIVMNEYLSTLVPRDRVIVLWGITQKYCPECGSGEGSKCQCMNEE